MGLWKLLRCRRDGVLLAEEINYALVVDSACEGDLLT